MSEALGTLVARSPGCATASPQARPPHWKVSCEGLSGSFLLIPPHLLPQALPTATHREGVQGRVSPPGTPRSLGEWAAEGQVYVNKGKFIAIAGIRVLFTTRCYQLKSICFSPLRCPSCV